MKRTPRLLLLCLLISLLVVPWLNQMQAQTTKFPYGLYAFENSGIYNNSGVPALSPKINNQTIMDFWYNQLKLNTFMVSPFYGTDLANFQLFKENYFTGDPLRDSINYFYESSTIRNYGESHYLKFSYANAAIYAISLNTENSNLSISPINGNYRVFNDGAGSRVTGNVVKNINVVGFENTFNMRTIRARPINTDSNKVAHFKARLRIINSNASNTFLTLKITNGSPDPNIPAGDPNAAVYTATKTLANTANIQEVTVECSLYVNNPSFYYWAPKVTLDCSMDFGKSFDIVSIELYDEAGDKLVNRTTELNSDVNLQNIITELNTVTANSKKPIALWMADEPQIGNFAPIVALKNYINGKLSSSNKIKTFFSSVHSEATVDPNEFNAAMTRFYTDVNPDYYIPNFYPCNYVNSYKEILAGLYNPSLERTMNFYKEHPDITINKGTQLYTTIQLHSDFDSGAREPNENEILSMSYLSLLHGFKGLMFWYAGPEQNVAGNKFLYTNLMVVKDVYGNIINGPGTEAYLTHVTEMEGSEIKNMYTGKRSALKKVGAYLNKVPNNIGGTIGDLLLKGSFSSVKIIGETSNTAQFMLGEEAKAQLWKADIMNTETWDLSSSTNLIGINYFSVPGDDASYYMIANLNEDGHACKVRLLFKSTNLKNFLRSYVLTDAGDYGGRFYPKNASILIDVPEDGFTILRIVNSDTDEYTSFPKGTRFGVARTVSGVTSIHLDRDFNSRAGIPEEAVINPSPSGNFEVISLYNKVGDTVYTDLATFRVIDPNFNTIQMKVEFNIYRQQTNGTFQFEPHTYYVRKPFTIADPSTFKIGPVAYDVDNDGKDDLCYYVAYNKQYSIYTYNQAAPIKTYPSTVPSTAPDYFSLKNGVVMGSKWEGIKTFYIYNQDNHYFYLDTNPTIAGFEKTLYMGNWFGGWAPMPFVGNWVSEPSETSEFGLYEFDKPYGYVDFRLTDENRSGGITCFEFPYGSGYPTDKPIVWKPRNLSAPKSSGEAVIEEEVAEIPSEYSISQNYPNPFNPTTRIQFSLPTESRVTLEVFNILGERVTELLNEVRQAGTMEVQFNGVGLPSGIYIYRFRATSIESGKHFEKINKMMLLK